MSLENFGLKLRRKRVDTGRSLEDVAFTTRIPLDTLKAMESGNLEELPPPVYMRGFIVTIVRDLGADEEEVLEDYNEALEHLENSPGIFAEVPEISSGWSTGLALFGLIVLAVLLIIGSYYLFNKADDPGPRTTAGLAALPAESAVSSLKAVDTDKADEADEADEKVTAIEGDEDIEADEDSSAALENEKEMVDQESEKMETSALPEPDSALEKETSTLENEPEDKVIDSEGQHTLKLVILEETWLRIYLDGNSTKQYLLKKGDTMTWQADNFFRLILGNAGGVEIYLNGELQPSPGVTGQVRNIILRPLDSE